MKTCTGCKKELSEDLFTRRKKGKQAGKLRSRCRKCESAAAQEWNKKNPDKFKRNADRWREKHRESLRARAIERYWKDPERFKEYNRNRLRTSPELRAQARLERRMWKKENPDKRRRLAKKYARRRYTFEWKSPGWTQPFQLHAKMEMWGWRCAYCKGPFETLDHAIPLSKGGSEWPANMRPSCMACNSQKGAKTPKEYAAYLAALVT